MNEFFFLLSSTTIDMNKLVKVFVGEGIGEGL
jgi:hypothetical protein